MDGDGCPVEVSAPSREGGPLFGPPDKGRQLGLHALASADFDHQGRTLSTLALTGRREALTFPRDNLQGCELRGRVHQAGLECLYRICLADVRSLGRVELVVPPKRDRLPDIEREGATTTVDASEATHTLRDWVFYARSTFDTGYAWSWGFEAAIQGDSLSPAGALAVSVGKGSDEVPIDRVAALELTAGTYATTTGPTCPLPGPITNLVALAGTTPIGSAVFSLASVARVGLAAGSGRPAAGPESAAERPKRRSLEFSAAADTTPRFTLSRALPEIRCPAIDRGATDGSIPFRAILEEVGEPDEDRSVMVWSRTIAREAPPLVVGRGCRAVPLELIAAIGMGSQGSPTIALRDGGEGRGLPYANWIGLVGETPAGGAARVGRNQIPSRVLFSETNARRPQSQSSKRSNLTAEPCVNDTG